jgi:hypothetical protein
MEGHEKKGRKERSLIERLMGGAPEDKGMEHNRIFPDVNFESGGGPPTDCLNRGKINSSLGKGSSTARPDGMAGIVAGKQNMKT